MFPLKVFPRLLGDTLIVVKHDTLIQVITNLKTNNGVISSNKIYDFMQLQANKWFLNQMLINLLVKKEGAEGEINASNNDLMGSPYLGSVIRLITFRQLPPFGVIVGDTLLFPSNIRDYIGNSLRFNTSVKILKNSCLLKAGQLLTLYDLEESERRLRNLGYIRHAEILVTPVNENEVDVIIVTQDKFPHAAQIKPLGNEPYLGVYSKNLFGFGLSFSHQTALVSPQNPRFGFRESFGFTNLLGYQWNGLFSYEDIFNSHAYEFQVSRQFASPDLKFGGGIIVNRTLQSKAITGKPWASDSVFYNYQYLRSWIGRSFWLSNKESSVYKNIYLIGEVAYQNFFDRNRLPIEIDPQNYGLFFTLGYSHRGYYKNKYLNLMGEIEDIPFGGLAAVTVGQINGIQRKSTYLSTELSYGRALIPKLGYLYVGCKTEVELSDDKPNSGFYLLNTRYLSPLWFVGNWRQRLYFNVDYLKGVNRNENESIFIDESHNGLTSFYSSQIKATQKTILKLESRFFLPRPFLGFKMEYYSYLNSAIFKPQSTSIDLNNHVFGFGTGIRLLNDRLSFGIIELQFAFYPYVNDPLKVLELNLETVKVKRFEDFIPQTTHPFNLY